MNIQNERIELYRDGVLCGIVIKLDRMFTLVTHEIPIDELFVMSGNDNSQLTLWHKRFRHLYAHAVLRMHSKQLATGMPILQLASSEH